MRLFTLFFSAAGAALLAAAFTPLSRRLALAVGAIDQPGERKIHSTPIPRLGGLAVILSIVIVVTVLAATGKIGADAQESNLLMGIAIGILPVLIISVIDDIRPLPPLPKLLAQTVSASIAVFDFGIKLAPTVHLFGKELSLGWLAIPISILWIVGVTNAFNLIDGLDGLSAGLALISAISLAGVSLLQGANGVASLALIVAGALLGFLPSNLYPARMFLGDSGSAPVGYILACIVIGGISPRVSAGMAILVPVVVLGLPIADTLISICRRTVRRMVSSEPTNILEGDMQHIHHRLLQMGLHQKEAVFILYVIGIALSACAIGSMFMTSQSAALLLLTIMTASFVGISRLGYDEFALIRRGVVLS
jgi:UDP-GlcNAc:undecaprenyl-phosphate/decaprenyl-phosphate GlcNAc-1-phosphate transferase